jgi:hypothetical protein
MAVEALWGLSKALEASKALSRPFNDLRRPSKAFGGF